MEKKKAEKKKVTSDQIIEDEKEQTPFTYVVRERETRRFVEAYHMIVFGGMRRNFPVFMGTQMYGAGKTVFGQHFQEGLGQMEWSRLHQPTVNELAKMKTIFVNLSGVSSLSSQDPDDAMIQFRKTLVRKICSRGGITYSTNDWAKRSCLFDFAEKVTQRGPGYFIVLDEIASFLPKAKGKVLDYNILPLVYSMISELLECIAGGLVVYSTARSVYFSLVGLNLTGKQRCPTDNFVLFNFDVFGEKEVRKRVSKWPYFEQFEQKAEEIYEYWMKRVLWMTGGVPNLVEKVINYFVRFVTIDEELDQTAIDKALMVDLPHSHVMSNLMSVLLPQEFFNHGPVEPHSHCKSFFEKVLFLSIGNIPILAKQNIFEIEEFSRFKESTFDRAISRLVPSVAFNLCGIHSSEYVCGSKKKKYIVGVLPKFAEIQFSDSYQEHLKTISKSTEKGLKLETKFSQNFRERLRNGENQEYHHLFPFLEGSYFEGLKVTKLVEGRELPKLVFKTKKEKKKVEKDENRDQSLAAVLHGSKYLSFAKDLKNGQFGDSAEGSSAFDHQHKDHDSYILFQSKFEVAGLQKEEFVLETEKCLRPFKGSDFHIVVVFVTVKIAPGFTKWLKRKNSVKWNEKAGSWFVKSGVKVNRTKDRAFQVPKNVDVVVLGEKAMSNLLGEWLFLIFQWTLSDHEVRKSLANQLNDLNREKFMKEMYERALKRLGNLPNETKRKREEEFERKGGKGDGKKKMRKIGDEDAMDDEGDERKKIEEDIRSLSGRIALFENDIRKKDEMIGKIDNELLWKHPDDERRALLEKKLKELKEEKKKLEKKVEKLEEEKQELKEDKKKLEEKLKKLEKKLEEEKAMFKGKKQFE